MSSHYTMRVPPEIEDELGELLEYMALLESEIEAATDYYEQCDLKRAFDAADKRLRELNETALENAPD